MTKSVPGLRRTMCWGSFFDLLQYNRRLLEQSEHITHAKRKLYWLCLTMKCYTIRHSVPFQRSQSVNLLMLCPYMHCCQNINCLLKVLSQSSSFSYTFLVLHSLKSIVTKLTVQLNIRGFKGSSDGKHLQISSSYDASRHEVSQPL